MKKLFVAVIVASLETILLSISTQAGALAFDAAGNLFERGTDSIFKFTPDGNKSTFASGLNSNSGVYNLAFDAAGNLFVSDEESHSILKFTPDGKKSTFASGLGTYGVYNLAFDGAGNLFVADPDSRSILKFTPDGTSSSFTVDVSSTSPDKKWEFVGGEQPRILEAGTHQVVLDLLEDRGRGGLVWAPDSKRFAFNYSVHGRRGY